MVDKALFPLNLSQKERKLITSLKFRKYREEHSSFIAEGEKVIHQLLPFFDLQLLIVNKSLDHLQVPLIREVDAQKLRVVDSNTMKTLSDLESRQDIIALFSKNNAPSLPNNPHGICVGLEEIQNPGNMGTIIRLCDWLGIEALFCSKGCVDIYSPKVVQATAGALGNVTIYENIDFKSDLPKLFEQIIATSMEGKNYKEASLSKDNAQDNAIIIFGNEGNGIKESTLSICTSTISIPAGANTISESLNVSLSAAIILSHIV